MSDHPTNPEPVQPLKGYDGPWECYTVDPTTWSREDAGRGEGDCIRTSLVVDHYDLLDAVALYIEELDETVYIDVRNARRLVEMLERDILKLGAIAALDPEDR